MPLYILSLLEMYFYPTFCNIIDIFFIADNSPVTSYASTLIHYYHLINYASIIASEHFASSHRFAHADYQNPCNIQAFVMSAPKIND